MFSLPFIPTDGLSQWIQPGALLGFIGLLLAGIHGMRTEFKEEISASEARQAKHTDELRADMKADMKELRADNRALGKMDRLLEVSLTVKQT